MSNHLTDFRFLALSIVFNISWLAIFYLVFVSFLQLMSELTGCEDRVFFQSWWNAVNLEEFWRLWNLPVHRWCVKHIYRPLVKAGWSKLHAMVVVFLLSAAAHEFIISTMVRVLGHFAFIAFLGQSVLCKLSCWFTQRCGPRAGNILVWIILVLGNTAGVVIYYKQARHS